MADIRDSINQREAYRKHPFPIPLEMVFVNEYTHINREMFIRYYTNRFSDDLKQYYDITMDFGDKTYPFVLNMACFNMSNTRRLSMQWDNLSHFYMFSVSVYFMSLCTQVIGKLFGWHQMENFMRASGWPMLNCGMGGLMHPIQVIFESELYPQRVDVRYFEILHTAEDYLIEDFLDFLKGNAANLNTVAYKKLCDDIRDIDTVAHEIKAQTNLFECWIGDPDTKYPGSYVKYPDVRNNPDKINKDISSYLSQYEEDVPDWLRNYKTGSAVSFSDIMSGRVGYYPGSGFDGTLMKIANRSRAVHSYLYVDYGISKKDLTDHLANPYSIRGYHSIGRIEWNEKDMMPNGQYPLNVSKNPLYNQNPNWFVDPNEKPYCFTEIMERDSDKDDAWGAERFAITFLFADGIVTYYQLFCMEYKKAPWILLLQDHGTGGNYDCYGKGGILDAIITKNDVRPDFVLCADNTHIWDGYAKVKNLPPVFGGMHRHPRRLYKDAK